MIRHITIKHQEKGTPKSNVSCRGSAEAVSNGSWRGLWGMIAFLAISLAALAMRDYNLFAALPETALDLLGDAPPAILVHAALAISTVSAIILIVGKGMGKGTPSYRWFNICLPVLFYPLYLIADTDRSSFILVLSVGMALLLLEHLTVRHCSARSEDRGHGLSRKDGGR